jgi:hypothetical protein
MAAWSRPARRRASAWSKAARQRRSKGSELGRLRRDDVGRGRLAVDDPELAHGAAGVDDRHRRRRRPLEVDAESTTELDVELMALVAGLDQDVARIHRPDIGPLEERVEDLGLHPVEQLRGQERVSE